MRAAIAGDIIGSRFEWSRWDGTRFETARCVGFDSTQSRTRGIGELAPQFELFHADCSLTDDSILTLAIMDWLLHDLDLEATLKRHFLRCGRPELFGERFRTWASGTSREPCGSTGNGAAMRVAPVAYTEETWDAVREKARFSAAVTHQTESAITGAEVIALGVFLARQGEEKEHLVQEMLKLLGQESLPDLETLRVRTGEPLDSRCEVTIPLALRAFLDSNSFEETIRRTISLGGDTDTTASMAGALAGAFWGTPTTIRSHVTAYLNPEQLELILDFEERYPQSSRTIY